MLMIILSWVLLLASLAIIAWVFFTKARGELIYWIRPVKTKTSWAVGLTLSDEQKEAPPNLLPDLNGFLRSHDRSTNTVVRQWNREAKTSFTGLLMPQPIDEESCLASGYELREIPGQSMIRLSGNNRISEELPVQALSRFAEKREIDLDLTHPSRLSGQSFSIYQWPLKSTHLQPLVWGPLAEWTLQLRNILVFPIIFTLFALGLLGTREPLLFAGGLFLLIFLSGACKFVFLYQREDEAQEVHLQNY